MSPAPLITREPSPFAAFAPDVEYVRVSDELALVRVAAADSSLASSTLIATGALDASRSFEALPDPVLGELSGTGSWRAAWAVPLALVEHDAALALVTRNGLVQLAPPRERLLSTPCRRELEVRAGRPYLRFVVGIITAALVPVALPSQSFASGLPPCPPPLVQSATLPPADAPAAAPGDEQARPDCVPDPAHPSPSADEVAAKPAPPATAAPKPKPKPKPASKPKPAPPKHAHAKPAPALRAHSRRPRSHPRPHPTAPRHAPHRGATPSPAPHPVAPRRATSPEPKRIAAPRAPVAATTPSPSVHAAAAVTSPPVRVVTLDSWGVPTGLLPIYQAAGNAYGIPWTVLAAVNKIETNYGQNLAVSSAGALGWMQFMPATWSAYGVDANGDGLGDPSDPADAIFAAARYLATAGGSHDIRKAIFAYNHAGWYVDSVMREASSLETVPQPDVDAMVAVMQASTPVDGAFEVDARSGHGRSVVLVAESALPAVAPVDGRVVAIGQTRSRGRYVTIEDPYGNRYSLAGLGTVVAGYPVAGAGRSTVPVGSYAQQRDLRLARRLLGLHADEVHVAPLRVGARVVAGTMLGRLRSSGSGRASTVFSMRSAGRLIDPAPALGEWLSATKEPSAPTGALPQGARADAPAGLGAALLLNKTRLTRRVLADTRLTLSAPGRRAIETGQVDARVLDTLELLADAKLNPTVSALGGATVDITSVDGVAIAADAEGAAAAKRLTDRLEALQGALRPDRILRGATQVQVVFAGSVQAIGHAANVQAAADRLDRMGLPYVWGGGHVTPTPTAPTGLDCSSSVSWVLQRAGFAIPTMVSGQFAHYGETGAGRYVTIYANDTHVFMAINGRFFGTSGFGHPDAGTGPAWFTRQPGAAYLAGFTVRHPPGL